MMSDDHLSPSDGDEDELKQALAAAFGDDALDFMDVDEEDDISPEMLAELSGEDQKSQCHTPVLDSLVKDLDEEDASPLVRYMQNLNRTIYGRVASVSDRHHQQLAAPEAANSARFVLFTIGNEQFGLPLRQVQEIARLSKLTELPCTPDWLRGVVNLRGQILSVTDLRKLLQLTSEQPAMGEKIVVVHSQQHASTTALVVDSVQGIRSVTTVAKETTHLGYQIASIATGTANMEQSTVILIDPDRLLACEDMMALTESH